MEQVHGQKIIDTETHRGHTIFVTKKDTWYNSDAIKDNGLPPQWAESLEDAKGQIDYLLGL